MYKLTEQQDAIINRVKEASEITLGVKALAGCGKTSTLLALIADLKPKKAFYTAFNKLIVKEAEEKFPSSVKCKTIHAFALQYVKPKKSIEDFTYLCITEKLAYPVKRKIMDAMESFFLSPHTDMYEYFEAHLADDKLEEIAGRYVEGMVEGKIAPTFNFLLKYLHILLFNKQIEIKFDLVLVDECQDVTSVTLEIIKLITAPKKVLVGDPHQNIYSFMNTVNTFDRMPDLETLELTKSFRCSPEIAARVEKFGKQFYGPSFHYEGTESKPGSTTAYISRTNAAIIKKIHELHQENISYTLTKPISEIFALPLALVTAASGKAVYHKKYKFLEKEYRSYSLSGQKSFFQYLSANVEDKEVTNAIKLLAAFNKKNINIFDVMSEAKTVKPNPNIYVVTAHSFKGMEVHNVYLDDDLESSLQEIMFKGGPDGSEDIQELNLYYVAMTRAKDKLVSKYN